MLVVTVPARAKAYGCQGGNAQSDLNALLSPLFAGQAYHYRGGQQAEDPATYIPNDSTTDTNIAMWDPAAEGQTSVRMGRALFNNWFVGDGSESVSWTVNAAYAWDLDAIQAAYGPITPGRPATISFAVSDFLLDTADVGILRMMWGRHLVEPETAPAPDHTTVGGFGETIYYSPSSAWRDPGATTAASPSAWASSDADVASPSTYFPGWSTLMDYGNGVPGQVPRIPQLPIQPLGVYVDDGTVPDPFLFAGNYPGATVGAVTVSTLPLVDAQDGRWLMLWVGMERDYRNWYQGYPPPDGIPGLGRVDLSVDAVLEYTVGSLVAPPLQQAARLIGGPPLIQRSREVRTNLLTARGRF
jgi:hypothetical protein